VSRFFWIWALVFLLVASTSVWGVEYGIAVDYPGDVGIESHPAVVFVEFFEQASIEDMAAGWDEVQRQQYMEFSPDVPPLSTGGQSLTGPGTDSGPGLYRRVLPGYEQLYLRFYGKFDSACVENHHYSWIGGHNPPTAWPWPRAGQKPAGDSHFSTGAEPFSGWEWDFYTYWHEMGCWGSDHTTQCHGNVFLYQVARPPAKRGEWFCWEVMLKLNSPPSEHNGEQAFWIDGERWAHYGPGFPNYGYSGTDKFWPDPAGDPFPGFQWRTVGELLINYIWIYNYVDTDPGCRAWFDHVVAATEYIGPMVDGSPDTTPPQPPANLVVSPP
jgi:hypothetical protein